MAQEEGFISRRKMKKSDPVLGKAMRSSSPAAAEKIHLWFGISLATQIDGVSLV